MDVPPLELTPDGVLLPVQAQPKARKNQIAGWHVGRLKVSVTEAPEKGKANQALLKLLAKSLGLKRSQVRLLSGETNSQKVFAVTDVSPEQLSSRIAQALGESAS